MRRLLLKSIYLYKKGVSHRMRVLCLVKLSENLIHQDLKLKTGYFENYQFLDYYSHQSLCSHSGAYLQTLHRIDIIIVKEILFIAYK